jgi:hypothetical protein
LSDEVQSDISPHHFQNRLGQQETHGLNVFRLVMLAC